MEGEIHLGRKVQLLSTAAILASLAAVSVTVSADETTGYTMYRLYNGNSGEHFYTKDKREQQELVNAGWSAEGTGWYAPESGSPVYRLYNKNAGDHHYTMSAKEKNELIQVGWSFEGIGWYSPDKGVALHRAYNPNANSGSHNYTISNEEQGILTKSGWKDEGIAWYGLETKKPTFSGIKDSQFTAGQIFDDHQGIVAADFLGRKLDYTVSGTIDPMTAGQYELTYQVTDEWKQTTTMKRKIVVKAVDVTQPEKPVLIKPTIAGVADITIAQNQAFDLKTGVKAIDSAGKPLPVIVVGTLDTKRPGEYYVSYQATDAFGATEIVNRKITVTATSEEVKPEKPEVTMPPVITGVKDQTMVQQLAAFDPKKGITATDSSGKKLLLTVIGGVDTKRPGDYYLAYQATDGLGVTTTVNQKVTVTEQAAPTITGTSDLWITQTMSEFDPLEGVRAIDAKGKVLDVKVDGKVDAKSWGLYPLTYIVSDDFGHQIKASRTIEVRTIAPPIIEGAKDITLTQSTDKFDYFKGITAKDSLGNELEVEHILGEVDLQKAGRYTLYYQATDMFENSSTVFISITVNALPSPIITGVEDLEMNQTSKEVDLLKGIEAKDSFGNKLDVKVQKDYFNPAVPDDYYYVSYFATDSFGNQSSTGRRIKVNKLADPVISGADSVTLTQQVGTFDPMEGISAKDGNGNAVNVTSSMTDKIDLSYPNTYGIDYEAVDEFGNRTSIYRTIEVSPVSSPIINGIKDLTYKATDKEFPLLDGVTATDYHGNEIPVTVETSFKNVKESGTGYFEVMYKATDDLGNFSTNFAQLYIEDNIQPRFEGIENTTVDISEGSFDVRKGVQAFDYNDEEIDYTTSGAVDFWMTGDNYISYEATDKYGHQIYVSRIVTVVSDPSRTLTLGNADQLHSGETKQLTAIDGNGNGVEVASWENLTPDVSTIDNNGKITILKRGIAKIKVTTVSGLTKTFEFGILDEIQAKTTIEDRVEAQNVITNFNIKFTNKDTRPLTITNLYVSSINNSFSYSDYDLENKGYKLVIQPGETVTIPYFEDVPLRSDYLSASVYVKTESGVTASFYGN